MIKPEYYNTIRSIRDILKDSLPLFPDCCCEESSHLIYRICYKRFKLEEVSGYYLHSGKRSFHSWNYDPTNKIYIDISMDQFAKNLPKIFIDQKTNYLNILQEDYKAYHNHLNTIISESFQNRIDWLLKKFIKKYPKKREQIIMR